MRTASKFRGVGGLVRVTNYTTFTKPSPAAEAFVNGGVELGFRGGPTWDFNIDAAEESTGYYQFNITRDGHRCSTAVAYRKLILDRPNLTVRTGVQVARIIVATVARLESNTSPKGAPASLCQPRR